eukprot:24512-Eustigmatos_ZCMA.PRE.1
MPPFAPRFITQEVWDATMFTDRTHCEAYFVLINYHLPEGSEKELVLLGMLGRMQCAKVHIRNCTYDGYEGILFVNGPPRCGKSALLDGFVGDIHNPGVLGPHLVPLNGSPTGKGGVGSLT